MKKNTICIFIGNRAEYGILFPIISELNGFYDLLLLFSGALTMGRWGGMDEIERQLSDAGMKCSILKVDIREDVEYRRHFGLVYEEVLRIYEDNEIDCGMVLGDRIEAFAFSVATFYSGVPLIHVAGGDLSNAPTFDSTVRHSISKLATYHLTTSDLSRQVLLQMGEEEKNVINIGNPSFDYDRLGFIPQKEELISQYGLEDICSVGILTFHPTSDKNADDNYSEYLQVYEGMAGSKLDKIIITYPNNDPGHEKILKAIENEKQTKRIITVRSLGTYHYLGLMKQFKAVVCGNSSSGLLETLFYKTPVLNVGSRQDGRMRGCNVTDVPADAVQIKDKTDDILSHYEELQNSYSEQQYIFGDGKASVRAKVFMDQMLMQNADHRVLGKKFVLRELK